MRVNTNVSQRAQQQLVLDNFGGIDFSSSPLLMASNRASYACNLINDNGVNHKRPGWEEQLRANKSCTCDKKPCICNRINGIYPYDANGHKALIIYAGTTFYEVEYDETSKKYGEPSKLMSNSDWESERVQFFSQRDKVYIIGCGDYLVYGSWEKDEDEKPVYEVKKVVDSDVYVPTTSIAGKPKVIGFVFDESGNKVYDKDEDGNEIVLNGNKVPTWQTIRTAEKGKFLDGANFLTKRRRNTFIGYQFDTDKHVHAIYETDVPYDPSTVYIKITNTTGKAWECIEGMWYFDGVQQSLASMRPVYRYEFDENKKQVEVYYGIQLDSLANYFSYSGDDDKENDVANVMIEFDVAEVENEAVSDLDASAITGCRFGTLFGAGGNSDRLFLSGNPNYPNADFYSEFDDYTYFTAQSQTVMGSDDVPITGYVRLSDSTLVTMKAGAVYEPSIYYRKAGESDAYIDEEKTVKKIVFEKWSGGTGEACISPHVISSLAEDDLILSPNGVFGIVEVNNLQTNNRYMRERSAFINGKLLSEPHLSEAVSFVYKNRYYLAVPTDAERNGAVYVADPRFKSYRSDDIDGSFNYEWWYWENVPARVFANIDGQLWFGCDDGRVCRFDDQFTDRTYEYSEDGCATFGNGVIVCNGEHIEQYKKCDAISFDGVVYKDNKTVSDSILTGIYYVKSCESVEKGYNIEICGYKSDNKEEMEKIPPINITGSVSARVRFHTIRNVCSTWYTPVFSLGATDVLKTLMRMTISVDPVIKGEVSFGYETRDIQRLLSVKVNPTLDFNNLSFEEFSFAADFATSYTVKSKVRKFNYIMFKFISDNDRDCAINNFKAIYTLTASHRGVF